MERLVCNYKQYYFCGTQKQCPLYDRCSQLPKLPKKKLPPTLWGLNYVYRTVYAVPLTYEEIKEHNKKYQYYNYFFGNKKQYSLEYYKKNKEMILKKKLEKSNSIKPQNSYFKIYDYFCNQDCKNCNYENCRLPEWKNTDEYIKIWKSLNKEKVSEINRKSYYKNRDKILAKQKEYRQRADVKQKRYEYDVLYRKTHPDIVKNKKKRYIQKHKEEINAKKRAYYELHKEEINAKRREYYELHREEINAKRREKYKMQKESVDL